MIDKEDIKDKLKHYVRIELEDATTENTFIEVFDKDKGNPIYIDLCPKLEAIKKAKEILTLMEKEIEG